MPEESETVKLVFELYQTGKSIVGIIRELEQRGITSPTGKGKWCRRSIDTILSNEKYRGGSVATSALSSYDPKNKPRTKFLYENHHPAIISNELFIAVAEEKQRRSNVLVDEAGVHRKKTKYSSKREDQKAGQ